MVAKTEPDTLQVATADGMPPLRRIPNAKSAYSILDDLEEANLIISVLRAQIMAHINGAPPYNQKEREEQGLAWASNVNFRELRNIVRTEASAVWNMLMRVESFLDLQLVDEKDIDPQLAHTEYGAIISEEFTRLCHNWESWEYETQNMINNMLTHGSGPYTFEDEWTWQADSFENGSLLVPINAKSDLSKWEVCAMLGEIKISELFELFDDPEASKDTGWNLSAARNTIKMKAGGHLDDDEDFNLLDHETYQKLVETMHSNEEDYFTEIKVAHLFSVEHGGEFAGRITHQIIVREREEQDELLFEHVGRFERWRDAIGLMLYDIGDGWYRSVRGLAFHLYPTSDISNRVTNDILTAMILRSGLILKGRAGDDSQLVSAIKKGPFTVIDSELEGMQQAFAPEIDSLLNGRRLMQTIQVNNTGAMRSRDEGDTFGQVPKSATQSSLEASKEAQFENNQAGWIYSQWKYYLTEMFRRLMSPDYPDTIRGAEERKQFIKRCKARGVPTKFLNFDKWKVNVVKAIGLGSPTQQLQITSALVNLSSMFDEEGRINALRDYLGSRVGYDAANRYVGRRNRNQIQKTDHTLAHIENQIFLQGGRIPVGTDQFHVLHVPIHFQFLANLSKQASEGADIKRIVPAFGTALEHVFGHIKALSADSSRKALVKQYADILNTFAAQFKTLQRQLERVLQKEAEEQRQRQEQMQQLIGQGDREERLERLRIQRDDRLSQERIRGENKAKQDKADAQIEMQNRKTEADIRRKDAESQQEQARKSQEVTA